MAKQDVKLIDNGSYYDVSIGDDGDIETEDSFNTSIITILFSDARASESEVLVPENRRGWIGNAMFGSKLWIYKQMRTRQLAANLIAGEVKRALREFIDAYATGIETSASYSGDTINFTATITRPNNKVEHRHYTLWNNTGA